VAGVQVLVRHWPGAELVTTTLAIRGGVQNVDARTQGVELLGLRTAASGGTASLDKDAFSKRLARLGCTLEASAGPDYSVLEAKSLRADFEGTLALLLDVFLHPGLSDSEVQLQRERLLQELKSEEENPDDALQTLSQQLLFSGTAYANRPQGTQASVQALTAQDVRGHLARLRTQDRLLVVVVGDVQAEEVLARLGLALSALPAGGALPPSPALLDFPQARLRQEVRPLPTTYVLASFAGPSWHSPDFATARLAVSALSNRAFLEVRTRRNLSYAPDVRLSTNRVQSFGALYVSAVEAQKALDVMQDAVREMAEEALSEGELNSYRASFLVDFFLGEETTDGAALRLVEAQLLGGDFRLARTLPQRTRATTPADVKAFVRRYVRNYQVAVVGPAHVQLSSVR
jgi:predicted Zn-dependent peptidase